MKKFPLLFCLVLFLAGFALAQTSQSTACPTIDVSGGGMVDPETPMSFTINVKDYDLNKLSYQWTISNGTIIEGEGTPKIVVDVSKLPKGANITATVTVEGLPEGCENTDSETGPICSCITESVLVDEFGNLQHGEVQNRIDSFYQFKLDNHPNAQGYIMIYGTRREISLRLTLIKRQIALRKYDASRITFIRGGANPNGESGVWTNLWIVPPGAAPPTP